MSKSEKIKEQIGWLKVVFGLLVATTVSLIGWMANNYDKASSLMIISSVCLVGIFVYGIVQVNLKAYKKMDELEEL